jgi:inosose dehydratase
LSNQSIKIGIAPINWSNDDMPELGGHYTLDTILSEMSEAGYKGTEIGNKFPSNDEDIKSELKKHNLELASSWHSTFFLLKEADSELEKVKQKCSLLNKAGANIINIAECSNSVHGEMNSPLDLKPVCSENEYDILAESLNKAGEICNSFGISLAFHHHMGTYIQNEKEIETLLSKTDPSSVYLCADTGHLYFAGVNPISFFEKYLHRIKHIHFKDLRLQVLSNINFKSESFLKSVLKGVFTVPGDGGIDFVTIGKIINDSGYKGWVIVEAEQDPAVYNPLEYAISSKKYLNKIWSN